MERLLLIQRHVSPSPAQRMWVHTNKALPQLAKSDSKLAGKVCIITGGNRGIGFQLARALAS